MTPREYSNTLLDRYTELCRSRRARAEATLTKLAAYLGISVAEAGMLSLLQATELAVEVRRGR